MSIGGVDKRTAGLAGVVLADRYVLGQRLGRGGFATVYHAWDRRLERDVAVKLMRVELFIDEGSNVDAYITRFTREAKMIANLKHPNILEVLDSGVLIHDEFSRPFIVMELLQGRDLGDVLDEEGVIEPTRAFAFMTQALDALAYVHRCGLVHRDLKPSNMFLSSSNAFGQAEHVHVMDFGIAHDAESETRLTNTRGWTGTPHYLPPEYVQTRHISPMLDVYQLGCVFYELLTGKTLFTGTTMQVLISLQMGKVPSPVEVIGSPLEEFFARALDADPSRRFADAAQMLDALREIDPKTLPSFTNNFDPTIPVTRTPLWEADCDSDVDTHVDVEVEEDPLSETVVDAVPLGAMVAATVIVPPEPIEARVTDRRDRSVGALLGLPVIALVIVALAGWWLIGEDDRDVEERPVERVGHAEQIERVVEPEAPIAQRYSLSSDPSGVRVFIDGDFAGATPLELGEGFEARDEHHLKFTAEGFVAVEQTWRPAESRAVGVVLERSRPEPVGSVEDAPTDDAARGKKKPRKRARRKGKRARPDGEARGSAASVEKEPARKSAPREIKMPPML